MNTYPVPTPPDRCALGHDIDTPECCACEDLANHYDDFHAWLNSDEGGRWVAGFGELSAANRPVSIADEHQALCHSDGSACVDGCDAAPLRSCDNRMARKAVRS